jgi:hypothetical protein
MTPDHPPASADRKPRTGADPVPNTPGQTTAQVDGESAPRLPHERDESADSQVQPPTAVGRQAHSDAASGRVDTDRGAPMDELYQREMRDATPTPPQPPHGRKRG